MVKAIGMPETDPPQKSAVIRREAQVSDACVGERLDKLAASLFQDYSRNQLRHWITEGALLVDEQVRSPSYRVHAGETIVLQASIQQPDRWLAEEGMAIQVLQEEASYLIINKAAGVVMHPGAGYQSGTLANGLLALYPELQALPRAGIVHRLDKDTTGLLIVARTEAAYDYFVQRLKLREVQRRYMAVVEGRLLASERIVAPIGRHPHRRLQMAVTEGGRFAATLVRPLEHYRQHTLVEVELETGRTHQIRVHMAWHGYPVLGDTLYGSRQRRRRQLAKRADESAYIQTFQRQALHARSLSFCHPDDGQPRCFTSEWPDDFQHLVNQIRTLG